MGKMTGTGTFFIIGARRSGTSILRRIVSLAPEIENILFEPHPLWHAVMMQHFRRFQGPGHQKVVDNFHPKGKGTILGAKIALNPGIDAMDWVWLPRVFKGAKFIFIKRNPKDNYASYYHADRDSVRGMITERVYSPMYQWIWGSMFDFWKHNQARAMIINYDKMIDNPLEEISRIWPFLGVTAPPDEVITSLIRTPENTTGKELAYRKMEFGKKAKDEPEEEIRRIEQEAHE